MSLKNVQKFLILVWLISCSAVMSFLMSTHMGVFKAGPVASIEVPPESANLRIYVHYLYAGCGCSRQVARRLIELEKSGKEHHRVFWIQAEGQSAPSFPSHVEVITLKDSDERLQEIHGAPQLHVYQHKKLIYQGGYSQTKASFLTSWVVDDLRKNRIPAQAPIMGCYVPKTQNYLSRLWKYLI